MITIRRLGPRTDFSRSMKYIREKLQPIYS